MILIVFLQALWATSIPLSKVLLTLSSPVLLAGIRMTIAGIILLGFKYFFTHERIHFEKKHVWFYLQIIFFGVYVKYILRYWGLSHLSTAKMSFMLNVTPFVVALFSYFSFDEKLSPKQWLGLFIGFLGLMPILLLTTPAEQFVGEFTIFSWPELAIFAEICTHSYALIVMRKMVRDNGYSSGMTNGIRMFGGGLLALITAFSMEGTVTIHQVGKFVTLLSILILVGNIICHNFYVHLLKYYSVTLLTFTDFLGPLFVAMYGWLFLHETITWHYFVSGAIVFIGLYLFYQEELFNIHERKMAKVAT